MKVGISKSKNTTIYYLNKSVRIGSKTTTKLIERIGTYEEIKRKCGDMDPLDWAKQYAAQRTAEEKNERQDIIMRYSATSLIDKNIRRSCNVGYLFLQNIYYSLGLDDICKAISNKYKFRYNLNEILSVLIYSCIMLPGIKRTSLSNAQSFLEQPEVELCQIYHAFEFLTNENDFIQSELYKNSQKVIDRKKEILYYDCMNCYFEIEQEDDFRKYGVSKGHKSNPIVHVGVFMDADGIPLSFSLLDESMNEQPSMTPLEEKVIKDFGSSELIICTDARFSSAADRRFDNQNGHRFITTKSIKKLNAYLQEFCLADDGWHLNGSTKIYKISELDGKADYDKTFYKDIWINEDGLEQHLVVTYSIKYREYQKLIRESQSERAQNYVSSPSKLNKKDQNDLKGVVEQKCCTVDGEIDSHSIMDLNQWQIYKESMYDGFYVVCTNLEDEPSSIIKINQKRCEIEECFRIMKTKFKVRSVHLSRKDRIMAHFMTCFIALIIYNILKKKLNERYTCDEIIKSIRNMNMLVIPGEGYIPIYTRTDLTDALHETFGFRTDYQIISQKNMRKILNQIKKD